MSEVLSPQKCVIGAPAVRFSLSLLMRISMSIQHLCTNLFHPQISNQVIEINFSQQIMAFKKHESDVKPVDGTIIITGANGSLGLPSVRTLLESYPSFHAILTVRDASDPNTTNLRDAVSRLA